jgi:predicted ArsR family transcriptional regulator
LTQLAGLAEQQRRTLYEFVAEQSLAVTRDEAAKAVGVSRPLAAYHLDRLVRDGLLEARFERRSGRTGPGAGRPAKLYLRSRNAVEVSVPARDYAFVAELLARAVECDVTGTTSAALRSAAHQAGRGLADAVPSAYSDATSEIKHVLAEQGYEPYDADDGAIRLRNCPFDSLAERHRDLVCGANLALVEGIAERLKVLDRLQPRLSPRPGECCVAVGPTGERGQPSRDNLASETREQT